MTDRQAIRNELLMDLDETLEAQGYIPLYDFAWTLRGYERGLQPSEIEQISHEAYAELTSRSPMVLMWTTWPNDVDKAWPAEEGTELDFDLDPDEPVDEPLLLLVPVED